MAQTQFYSKATGELIPEDQLSRAMAAGDVQIPKGADVWVQSGDIVSRESPERALQLMQQGWGLARSSTADREEKRLEASHLGNTALAAVEGVGEGLSLGLSRPLLDATLGSDYSEMADLRAQENPWAHGVGEIGGAVAPAFFTGGSSALARGLQFTPAGLLSRGSMAAGEALSARLGTGALGRAASWGTAGALEGAGAQIAQNASEISDEPLTAEKLFAGVGNSMILGGGVGALLGGATGGLKGTAGHLAPEVARVADDSARIAAAEASGVGIPGFLKKGIAKANEALGGAEAAKVERVLGDLDIGTRLAARDEVLPKVAKRMQGDLDEVSKLKTLTRELQGAPTLADEVRPLVNPGRLNAFKSQAAQLLDETIASKAGVTGKSTSKFLDSTQDKLEKALNGTDAAELRTTLENLRRDTALQKIEPTPKMSTDRLTEATAHNAVVDAQLARLDKALDADLWGDAATSWRNRLTKERTVTESGTQFRQTFEGGPEAWLRRVDEGDESVLSIRNHLDNEREVVESLLASGKGTAAQRAALEKSKGAIDRLASDVAHFGKQASDENMLQKIIDSEQQRSDLSGLVNSGLGWALGGPLGQTIATGAQMAWGTISKPGTLARSIGQKRLLLNRAAKVDAYVNGAVRGHIGQAIEGGLKRKTPAGRAFGAKGTFKRASLNYFGSTREERRANYQKRLDSIRAIQADPMLQQQIVTHVTRGIGDTHPGLVVAAAQQQAKAMAFLASKMPPPPKPNPLQPQLTKPTISDAEIRRMEKIITAVEKPMSVIDDWRNGVCSYESVEAVKAVYPGLYQQWSDTVQEELRKSTKRLPYNEQLQTSILLGLPGNHFQQPETLARTAAMYAQASQGQQQKGAPPSPTQQKAMAEADMTQSQRLESRL